MTTPTLERVRELLDEYQRAASTYDPAAHFGVNPEYADVAMGTAPPSLNWLGLDGAKLLDVVSAEGGEHAVLAGRLAAEIRAEALIKSAPELVGRTPIRAFIESFSQLAVRHDGKALTFGDLAEHSDSEILEVLDESLLVIDARGTEWRTHSKARAVVERAVTLLLEREGGLWSRIDGRAQRLLDRICEAPRWVGYVAHATIACSEEPTSTRMAALFALPPARRRMIAQEVARHSDPAARSRGAWRLVADEDSEVRRLALDALRSRVDGSDVRRLADILAHDPDHEVRGSAMNRLYELACEHERHANDVVLIFEGHRDANPSVENSLIRLLAYLKRPPEPRDERERSQLRERLKEAIQRAESLSDFFSERAARVEVLAGLQTLLRSYRGDIAPEDQDFVVALAARDDPRWWPLAGVVATHLRVNARLIAEVVRWCEPGKSLLSVLFRDSSSPRHLPPVAVRCANALGTGGIVAHLAGETNPVVRALLFDWLATQPAVPRKELRRLHLNETDPAARAAAERALRVPDYPFLG
ncbi:MAG: hypothetical protein IPL19_01310 [Sandaracinaceae bacterium]|jgi:hypothetical protein|nr:hypothetical protein [Sandaracinaceae bacterium]MBP7684587.1 hypothetical protein [Deltaproteobacteria bacterium]MBK7156141.1 hypothetical protein [Sandaracinaceae bacterium]MBK7775424.1 hypothetical protein [Sandaracinaceae bacterium]MBK8406598.1 hypothetical protein [Sandaracinaceae bacterium]